MLERIHTYTYTESRTHIHTFSLIHKYTLSHTTATPPSIAPNNTKSPPITSFVGKYELL